MTDDSRHGCKKIELGGATHHVALYRPDLHGDGSTSYVRLARKDCATDTYAASTRGTTPMLS